MTAFSLFRHRTVLFIAILFIAFSGFTVGILDDRVDGFFLFDSDIFQENDVTTNSNFNDTSGIDPIPFSCFVHRKSSAKKSISYFFPLSLRGPPFWS